MTAFRRPAHWPDLDAWRALTEEQRQERTRTMIAAAAPVLGVQPTADGRHLEITPTVRAQVSSGRLYVSTIQITDDPAAVDTARERLAAAGWTIYPLESIAFEAVPTVRILLPGVYLDAYRAAPRPETAPDALHALLTAAEATGEGTRYKALLDVPADLLPALDAVALGHFNTWGDEHIRRRATMTAEERETLAHRARAAYAVHRQAHYPGARLRPADRPQERP